MSLDQQKATARRFQDAFNARDLSIYDTICTPDVRLHIPGNPAPLGLAEGKQVVGLFAAAFPDCHDTVEEAVAEGDLVVGRGTFRGTQTGEFMGIPPTGRAVTMTWMSVDRFEGDRIAEHWAQMDTLGLLQQLGAIPAPATA